MVSISMVIYDNDFSSELSALLARITVLLAGPANRLIR